MQKVYKVVELLLFSGSSFVSNCSQLVAIAADWNNRSLLRLVDLYHSLWFVE